MTFQFLFVALFAALLLFSDCRTSMPQTSYSQYRLLFNPITDSGCDPPLLTWYAHYDSILTLLRQCSAAIPGSIHDTLSREVYTAGHIITCDDQYFHYRFSCRHFDSLPPNSIDLETGDEMLPEHFIRDQVNRISISRHCNSDSEATALFYDLNAQISKDNRKPRVVRKARILNSFQIEPSRVRALEGLKADTMRKCGRFTLTIEIHKWDEDVTVEYSWRAGSNL